MLPAVCAQSTIPTSKICLLRKEQSIWVRNPTLASLVAGMMREAEDLPRVMVMEVVVEEEVTVATEEVDVLVVDLDLEKDLDTKHPGT
jgi:hypothetical protein